MQWERFASFMHKWETLKWVKMLGNTLTGKESSSPVTNSIGRADTWMLRHQRNNVYTHTCTSVQSASCPKAVCVYVCVCVCVWPSTSLFTLTVFHNTFIWLFIFICWKTVSVIMVSPCIKLGHLSRNFTKLIHKTWASWSQWHKPNICVNELRLYVWIRVCQVTLVRVFL